MKYSYVIISLLFIAGHTSCCYRSSSKSSYSKDSSSLSGWTISQSSHQAKQQETTAQKLRSFAYSNQLFSQLDRSSAQLVNTVAHKLQTAPNAHDYALYLGIFNALAITSYAQQHYLGMSQASQALTAVFQNNQIQQQQADTIRNALDTAFSEQNNTVACKKAHAISNALVRIVGGFVEQMPPIGPHTDLELSIGASNARQLPGLPQIKEFVAKFGELSSNGKKVVGKMFLAGNILQALKLIAHGDRGVYIYDHARQNTIEGANPKCKVKTFSTYDKRFFTFDCERIPSSLLAERNRVCKYNILKNHMTCLGDEKPFTVKFDPDKLFFLSNEFYNGVSLIPIYELANQDMTVEKFVNLELVAAKERIKNFQSSKHTFSSPVLTHLYAQALLIGQNIFNLPLPEQCVREMVSHYGMSFTLPKNNEWTTQDIKNELHAAEKYLASHVLYEKDMPQGFEKDKFQYAQALVMARSIADNTSLSCPQGSIKIISQKNILNNGYQLFYTTIDGKKEYLSELFRSKDLSFGLGRRTATYLNGLLDKVPTLEGKIFISPQGNVCYNNLSEIEKEKVAAYQQQKMTEEHAEQKELLKQFQKVHPHMKTLGPVLSNSFIFKTDASISE